MGLFENWVLRNPSLEYSVLTHVQSLYITYIYIYISRERRTLVYTYKKRYINYRYQYIMDVFSLYVHWLIQGLESTFSCCYIHTYIYIDIYNVRIPI